MFQKQEMIAIKKQELEEINRKKEEERIRRNKEREKRIKQILEKNQEDHIWYEIPGADHDDKAIRSGIYNFIIRWKSANE